MARITSAGEGVERGCLQSGYRTTVGGRISAQVLTPITRVAVTARIPTFREASTCVDGFPPPDGTYIIDDRVNLLAARYVATDVRVEVIEQHRYGVAFLGAGAGNSWRSAPDVPYFLVAAGMRLKSGKRLQFGVEGEYQRLRVPSDRVRRTYRDFQLVDVEPLGRVHDWSHLLAFSAVIGVAF
jgi:hypothetical protein